MKEVKRYVGVTGSIMVIASDYDALMVERDELLAAIKAMCEEFRGHDLPYGSKAYCAAKTAINKSEYPQ